MQACWYSMHRPGIYASLSGVPGVHTASGYPAFSTDAASAFSFRISSHAFPGAQRQSGLHGSPPHSLRLPLRSSLPVLYSGVLHKPIFPVTVQIHDALWNLRIRAQCAVQPVFFTGEIDEPSVPRTVPSDCITVQTASVLIPKIHTADNLVFYRRFCEDCFFCVRKTQEVLPVPSLQRRGRGLPPIPVFTQVLHIRMAQPYTKPLPVMAIIQLQVCVILPLCRLPCTSHHGKTPAWHGFHIQAVGFPVFFHWLFP